MVTLLFSARAVVGSPRSAVGPACVCILSHLHWASKIPALKMLLSTAYRCVYILQELCSLSEMLRRATLMSVCVELLATSTLLLCQKVLSFHLQLFFLIQAFKAFNHIASLCSSYRMSSWLSF